MYHLMQAELTTLTPARSQAEREKTRIPKCRSRIKTALAISLGAILALASFTVHGATTRYVSPLGAHDTANGFDSWAGAATNIQDAVDIATAGDTVRVTNATYRLAASVTVAEGITLLGNETPDAPRAILDGQGAVRCLNVQHTDAVIQGFVVSNGYVNALQAGGGGYIKDGTIEDCIVIANLSTNGTTSLQGRSQGGGLYVENGTVRDCLFMNNMAAGDGAGLFAKRSLVEDSVIVSNRSIRIKAYAYGSGIDVDNSVIKRCEILQNGGALWGGGARANGTDARMINCRIADNSAVGGGGLYLTTNARFVDGVIASNEALSASSRYGGGGVYVSSGIVSNTLIEANTLGNGNMSDGPHYHGGAGAMLSGPSAKLMDCHVVSNTVLLSGTGGGIFMLDGIVANSKIEYNVSQRITVSHSCGQGLAMLKGTVTNCVIRYNQPTDQSDMGGGVFMESGTLVDCHVVSNATGYRGGGIYMGLVTVSEAPPAEVRDCVVLGNHVWRYDDHYGEATGGGIYMGATNAIVRNTLVANNGAIGTKFGGGIYLENGTIESITLTGNQARDGGGGLYRTTNGLQQSVVNTIVWHNDADLADDEIANPSDTVFAHSCSPVLTSGVNGNLAGDPLFVVPTFGFGYLSSVGDYSLSGSSPCIDTGRRLDWMVNAVDLNGQRRIWGDAPDMGAYETERYGTLLIMR